MRIALVGTSNSVMKHGFASILAKHPHVSTLANLSLGASSSVHSVRSTEHADFSDFDFCLFEFAVNEDVLVRNNVTTSEQIHRVVRTLAARCLQSSCLPVVTIFPRITPDGDPQVARQIYLEFARSLNLPFFDGYKLVQHIHDVHGVPPEELFMDRAHVAPWLSSLCGNLIAESLYALLPRKDQREVLPWQANLITQVKLADSSENPGSTIFRKNSRFEDTFLILPRNQSHTVDISHPDSCVIGICVSLTHTSCLLSISGRNHVNIDLRSKYFDDPKRNLVISMLPIRTAIYPLDGKILLKCVSPGEKDSKSVISTTAELGKEIREPKSEILEISRLVLQSGERITLDSVPAKSLHHDLLDPLPYSVIRSCVDVFRFADKGTLRSQRELKKSEKRRQKRAAKRADPSKDTPA